MNIILRSRAVKLEHSRERMDAALNGRILDRPPVSLWFHFGSEHLSPQDVARLHLDFQRAYGWDFLKVMFDFRFDLPVFDRMNEHALDEMLTRTDWDAPFARQRDCVARIYREIGDETPIVDSGYSPWHLLLRHVGHDQAAALRSHPDLTLALLDKITQATCNHISALREIGIYGYFHATMAAASPVSDPVTHERFQNAHDRAILSHAKGLTRILHLHGSNIDLGRVTDYPCEIMHCSDRAPGNPDLSRMRSAFDGCLMGGLCERTITQASLPALSDQIAAALAASRPGGFILAPGCTVSPSIPGRSMDFLKTEAARLSSAARHIN